MVRVVAISDTHTYHNDLILPHGDILIHAGDFTFTGKEHEVRSFGEWFKAQPHQHKVCISGNHDLSFERNRIDAMNWLFNGKNWINEDFHYLQDNEIIVKVGDRNIKIYGSPHQPWFHNWAFNLPRGPQLEQVWDFIPNDTDILVTHGPPQGILDMCDHGERVGCDDLWRRVMALDLKLHIFGHIHESYGTEVINNTTYVNASSCNLDYRAINQPIVIDI